MTEIVKARQILTPFINSPLEGGQGGVKNDRTSYAFKSHCIHHNLYGVDIDPSAVEICKLRLWLSLVVDEQRIDVIEPLPNLDYKIVRGNSLINMPENVLRDQQLEKEIERLVEKYFAETDKQAKRELKDEIDGKIKQLLKSAEQFTNYPIDFDFKLFFHEVFKEKGGFDVVIGNPPYVRVQNLSHRQIDILKRIYTFAWRRIDVSLLFFEQSQFILNRHGVIIFISSNQFLKTEYGRNARKYFATNKSIISIIDFGDLPVFEQALNYTSIFKIGLKNDHIRYYRILNLPFTPPKLSSFLKIKYNLLNDEKWLLSNPRVLTITKKIEKNSLPLISMGKAWTGIITGLDALLLFDADNLPNFIEPELLKPILRPHNIRRNSYTSVSKYVFYPYKSINGKTVLYTLSEIKYSFPNAYNFIIKYEKELKGRQDSRKLMGDKKGWYGLIRFGNISKFNEFKIVTPGEVKRNKFALDIAQATFSCARVFSINPKQDVISVYSLLCILNSSIVEFYLHLNASIKAGGYFTYSSTLLDEIPIKIPVNVKPFELVSKMMLEINDKNEPNKIISMYFDQLIDGMVFELYFEDEVNKAGRDILKYLTGLTPITDDMSDEQKMQVITKTFNELYDKNHPVRQNLYYMDTIEEIRIIKGLS